MYFMVAADYNLMFEFEFVEVMNEIVDVLLLAVVGEVSAVDEYVALLLIKVDFVDLTMCI